MGPRAQRFGKNPILKIKKKKKKKFFFFFFFFFFLRNCNTFRTSSSLLFVESPFYQKMKHRKSMFYSFSLFACCWCFLYFQHVLKSCRSCFITVWYIHVHGGLGFVICWSTLPCITHKSSAFYKKTIFSAFVSLTERERDSTFEEGFGKFATKSNIFEACSRTYVGSNRSKGLASKSVYNWSFPVFWAGMKT